MLFCSDSLYVCTHTKVVAGISVAFSGSVRICVSVHGHSGQPDTNSNTVITIAIRLRSDYDVSRAPASIRGDSTRAKNENVNFYP